MCIKKSDLTLIWWPWSHWQSYFYNAALAVICIGVHLLSRCRIYQFIYIFIYQFVYMLLYLVFCLLSPLRSYYLFVHVFLCIIFLFVTG